MVPVQTTTLKHKSGKKMQPWLKQMDLLYLFPPDKYCSTKAFKKTALMDHLRSKSACIFHICVQTYLECLYENHSGQKRKAEASAS